MKKRPDLTVCAAITADGKLDETRPLPGALLEFFAPQPGDVLLEDSRAAEHAEWSRTVRVTAREDLAQRLRSLRAEEVRRVFCGGGPRLFRRLFDGNLVDEICLIVRPQIDGRRGAPTLSGVPDTFFPASIRCRLLQTEVRGSECLLRYRVWRAKAHRPASG